jgi:hypothetical protein
MISGHDQHQAADAQRLADAKEYRLSALLDSPRAFLSSYDREKGFDEAKWRAEFDRVSGT